MPLPLSLTITFLNYYPRLIALSLPGSRNGLDQENQEIRKDQLLAVNVLIRVISKTLVSRELSLALYFSSLFSLARVLPCLEGKEPCVHVFVT